MATKKILGKTTGATKKTAAARKSKPTAPRGPKPSIPPQPLPPSPSMSELDLEARLNLFKVELGKDKILNAAFNTIYAENSGDWAAISAELNPKKGFDTKIVKKLEFTHHLAAWSRSTTQQATRSG